MRLSREANATCVGYPWHSHHELPRGSSVGDQILQNGQRMIIVSWEPLRILLLFLFFP